MLYMHSVCFIGIVYALCMTVWWWLDRLVMNTSDTVCKLMPADDKNNNDE